MQEDHQQKHIAKLRKVALMADERREIREGLAAYIAYHPVRSLPSPFEMRKTSRIGWLSHHLAAFGAGLAVVALLVCGVSYAAEGAMPGHSLYPVKVLLTEEVRGWLAWSEEAKAVWEVRRAERRLEEAEVLVRSGGFSDDLRADIASRLETHAKAAAARLGKLASASGEARVAARVSSELESSLRAHERILLSLEDTGGEGQESAAVTMLEAATSTQAATTSTKVAVRTAGLSPLVAQIRLSIDDITSIRIQAEGDASDTLEASAMDDEFTRAAEILAEAREIVERSESGSKAGSATEARARLDTAEEALSKAQAAIEAQQYAEALSLFHTSIRASIEARILARTSAHIESIDGEPVDVTTTPKQGSSTPSKKGQGASVIDILIDTEVNSGSTTPSGSATTKSSTTGTGVKIESNTNSATIKTSVNVKVNTGGH